MQTLSNVNSPVLSPQEISALQNASPADVVQLSSAALQLESVDAMFGFSAGPPVSPDANLNSLLANLDAALTSTTPGAVSTADQAAAYQSALQAAESAALFGSGSAGGLSGSLFDVLG
jgi:hypothetical protein